VTTQSKNQLCLDVVLMGREAVRYTPSGVPVVSLQLSHRSGVLEGNLPRVIEFDIDAMALGTVVNRLQQEPLGSGLRCWGFLALKQKSSTRLVVHVTEFERLPGLVSTTQLA